MIGQLDNFNCCEDKGQYILFRNKDGQNIGISKFNTDGIIYKDGLFFKDHDHTGILNPYKDWRLESDIRANDLANKLSIEEIAGLMLYSSHQTVTKKSSKYEKLFGENTYDGKKFQESNCEIWHLTDQQKSFLENDYVRHILLSSIDSAKEAALWANEIQSFCEMNGLGLPANISSDPRHGISSDAEYNLGAGSDISKWPENLGLAATFDPSVTREFAEICAKEYRSLGITTALSPQIDLATDPRWRRFIGTFGENTKLSTDMAEAYCDALQSTYSKAHEDLGWGTESVNAMVKHWPGGGSGEGGRDAHYCYGKYAVYPGNNFFEHLKPFINGAFKLSGKTKKASATMPYYTISYNQDSKENIGNGYSKYIVSDLLRHKYQYNGVICTDWLITANHGPNVETFSGKCWGLENESVAFRHFKALEAGVDQFGGNNDIVPVLGAYKMLVAKYGEDKANERMRLSARRLLINMFQTGLFDNPYVDVEKTILTVGCSEYTQKGYMAQIKSVVMLKNNNILPIKKRSKVYIPNRKVRTSKDWFGNILPEISKPCMNLNIVKKYYDVVNTPEEADFAIVSIMSPVSDGYDKQNGYIPITLQYRPYTASCARKTSIAKGEPLENNCDRNYFGKSNYALNEMDLDMVIETKKLMRNKPVVVSIMMKKPCVISEFEKYADVILVHFSVQDQSIIELVKGIYEPSGLLPFQIPKDMKTVEEQYEDVSGDMECYIDESNHKYDFAYGMNFSGIISDQRVYRYKK